MASAELKKVIITSEEYLKLERAASFKSEFYKGEVFAMSGASRNHNVISLNFASILINKLKGKGCRPYTNDMRVHIPSNSLYTYPDITVVCGEEEFLDNEFDTLLNPLFITEVLSPSTADYDTGRKFMLYRSIPTLKEYWVISSMEYRLQQFLKTDENTWVLHEIFDKTGTIQIPSLDVSIQLEEIYDGVEFKS